MKEATLTHSQILTLEKDLVRRVLGNVSVIDAWERVKAGVPRHNP
jgi:hypothetical protein